MPSPRPIQCPPRSRLRPAPSLEAALPAWMALLEPNAGPLLPPPPPEQAWVEEAPSRILPPTTSPPAPKEQASQLLRPRARES